MAHIRTVELLYGLPGSPNVHSNYLDFDNPEISTDDEFLRIAEISFQLRRARREVVRQFPSVSVEAGWYPIDETSGRASISMNYLVRLRGRDRVFRPAVSLFFHHAGIPHSVKAELQADYRMMERILGSYQKKFDVGSSYRLNGKWVVDIEK